MKQYKTLKTVELFAGQIGLSDEQAAPRADRLKAIEKGVYEIIAPVQFKAGEVIGLEDAPGKHMSKDGKTIVKTGRTSISKVILAKLELIKAAKK